jgi:2-dehydro-3-deoxygluconokinase
MDEICVRLRVTGGARWACISLGEVMLRLDPGEDRIRTARTLRVWEGGASIT